MFEAAATGYLTALSLILAIGAQNAFVLRQGVRREHVFWVCLVCSVSDALLITAGVSGFGQIVDKWPGFPTLMAWGGAIFLFFYGALRFRSAYLGDALVVDTSPRAPLSRTMAACLALTWLNPHVYLDTVGLIGAVSTQFHDLAKVVFGIAAVAASFTFFFSLGYGARLLAPLLATTRAWRILDTGIAVLMWCLAIWLLNSV